MELARHIDTAFEKAEKLESKLPPDILAMQGMTGKKTRHFYNNLLDKDDVRYLEIGTWMGSSVCSAMYGNKATVLCIDNWSEFGGPKDEFLKNINTYKGENNVTFVEGDCFQVDVSRLPKFNIYMYDGNHSEESHFNALVHYYDCLDDVFVFVVDDWDWDVVRRATRASIKHLALTVLYEKEVFLDGVSADTWWNGMYVAILQKPSTATPQSRTPM
jgi:hypothetical protein